jgi:hypothetical protein
VLRIFIRSVSPIIQLPLFSFLTVQSAGFYSSYDKKT